MFLRPLFCTVVDVNADTCKDAVGMTIAVNSSAFAT